MATVYVLDDSRRGATLTITLSGEKVVTDQFPEPVVQTFPSAAAAKEHIDLVLARRKREGYAVTSATEVEAASLPSPDQLAGSVIFDQRDGRAKITFKGDEVPATCCAELVARLARDPPRSIEMACDLASPGKAWAAALAGRTFPSVEAFVFDTSFQTVARQARNAIGDVADVLAAFPALTRLFVTGDVALTPTRHEALRQLHLIGDPLERPALQALGACSFPALVTLAITVAHETAPGPHHGVAAALRSLAAPSVQVVHVDGVDVTRFLDALAETALPASWRTLSVRGSIDDEDRLIAVLEKRRGALGTLETLGLPGDEVSGETMAVMRDALPAVQETLRMPELLGPEAYQGW